MSASYCFEKNSPGWGFFIFRGGELVKRYGRQTPTFEYVTTKRRPGRKAVVY